MLGTCVSKPGNAGSDVLLPAKTSPQLVADGGSVFPALEQAADEQGVGVEEGRPAGAGEVGSEGEVKGQRSLLGDLGARTKLGQRVDASHVVADVEPLVDPAGRVTPQHRRSRSCRAFIHSLTHLLTYSFIQFVHSFVLSFVRSFIHSFSSASVS